MAKPTDRKTHPSLMATGDPHALLQAVVDHVDAQIFVKRRDGRILHANRHLRDALGCDPVGLDETALFEPETAAQLRATDRAIFETGQPFQGEERVVDQEGRERFYTASKFLAYDATLDDDVLCCVVTDITETKAVEIQNRRMRQAIDLSPVEFALFDPDDRLIGWNASYERLHPAAFARADAEDRAPTYPEIAAAEVAEAPPPDGAEAEIARRIAAHRNADGRNAERVYPDGSSRQLTKYRLPDGSVAAMAVDITAMKAAQSEREGLLVELQAQEARLREALEREREVNGQQRQFVGMVCHEFRTPLAIIDAAAGRLRRKYDTMTEARRAEAFQTIHAAVSRTVGLIDSMLSAARLEAGGVTLAVKPFSLAALLRETAASYALAAGGRHVYCDVDGLDEDMVGDPALLQHVFSNVVGNAIKYSPDGQPVRVAGRVLGPQAVVTVQDEGLGIDPEEVPRVFERFYRAKTSTGIVGVGIGLHLARELVEMHEGAIGIDSAPGEGSTVTIQLPLAGPTANRDGAAA